MQKARLKRLLHQYFNNTITGADCIELLDYLNSSDNKDLNEYIDEELLLMGEGPAFKGQQSQDVLNLIKSDPRFRKISIKQTDVRPKIIRLYQQRWLQVAAAVFIFCTAGIIIFNKQRSKAPDKVTKINKVAPIVPGSNKAILTIAGGKTIVLDSANNGIIAQTGISKILKTHNGQIVYHSASAVQSKSLTSEISYNTLTTPKGGEYQVVLPDGTKVWLDAASSITYPVAFTGNDRRVKLTGQGYFEVAKNKAKPFYVSVNDVQIRVLGTHFNISAYADDNEITTTLLEGSVQVTKNNTLSLLKPGQQAVINNNANYIAVSEANIDDALAWKNGYFIFNDDNVTGIMKKVSRWYDVDVEYRGNFDNQQFGGTFYRTKSLSELLEHLEKIGKIHFTVSGRRVIVMD